LLRAANVFTAASNVVAGFLLVQGEWAPAVPLLLLLLTSALLYEAGMVLNDALDATVDRVERPERPIPSGRVARSTALGVGWLLLAGGVAMAGLVSWRIANLAPLIVAAALAAVVAMYDLGLKATWAGPWAMGWCRMLNVLLGASVAVDATRLHRAWFVAAAIGLYTTGITYLARSEVRLQSGAARRLGVALPILGLMLLAAWGKVAAPRPNEALWLAGVIVLAAMTWASRPLELVRQASPLVIRRQVGRMILGFLLIDAWVAGLSAGWTAALVLLALVVPTSWLARSAPMT
jgi:4-hydroxybenzoate polyprenyltransferase